VDFLAGGTVVGSSTAAPYTATWTNVPAGSYSISARATDSAGGVATSSPVSVAVVSNALPTIALTAPAPNAQYYAPATLTLSAAAADADGTIARVEFYADGALIGTSSFAPYAMVWDGVASGTHVLAAKAIDNAGGSASSSPVTVTVIGPSIGIEAALDGATIDDDNVLVRGFVFAPANAAVTVNGVVTHIDDRFDTGMRDALGADAAALLPEMDRHDFTFLVEDPATVWHLGGQRYTEIAKRYEPLTRHTDRLAIDLNIVERYQDVYPTKQQTGTELFQLVRAASLAFSRVALYFENSILPQDVPLLAASAAAVTGVEYIGKRLAVRSRQDVRVAWDGPVTLDGRPWPAVGPDGVLVPAGDHVLEPADEDLAIRLLDLTGDLVSARALRGGLEIAYRSSARVIAVISAPVASIEIDGEPGALEVIESRNGRTVVMLPRGQHVARLVKG
jgi:hypothetical protein